MAKATLYIGKLHVVKVPSRERSFFPYSHFSDKFSGGPLLELLSDKDADGVLLRITGLAKLKPNIQTNPKLRVDIYGPHTTALDIAQQICRHIGVSGDAGAVSTANPEAARKGPQTLPKIDKSYKIPIESIRGRCSGFEFFGATRMYFDHERPAEEHIEMVGPEMHLGIPMDSFNGTKDPSLILTHDVPTPEIRVVGEANPIEFSAFAIVLKMTNNQACDFAATILASYS